MSSNQVNPITPVVQEKLENIQNIVAQGRLEILDESGVLPQIFALRLSEEIEKRRLENGFETKSFDFLANESIFVADILQKLLGGETSEQQASQDKRLQATSLAITQFFKNKISNEDLLVAMQNAIGSLGIKMDILNEALQTESTDTYAFLSILHNAIFIVQARNLLFRNLTVLGGTLDYNGIQTHLATNQKTFEEDISNQATHVNAQQIPLIHQRIINILKLEIPPV